jgi:hypothetical protein
MRRISSKATFWYKWVFPIVWFGFLAVFIAIGVFASAHDGGTALLPFIIMPAVMIVIGYFIMKKLVFDLVDEVWDDGAALIVKDKDREDRIALSNIVNISYSPLVNPPRVTLTLRQPTNYFGTEISFSAPIRFVPFAKSELIEELIRRVDAARRK